MTAPLVEQAPAKINLTLRVLGRRADGYHELESLVAFADLADTLTLQPGPTTALDISGPFAAVERTGLRQSSAQGRGRAAPAHRRPDGGALFCSKNIPVAAGIGGGSADAAAALRLLARANGLALDDPRLNEVALLVGADVPVCLASRPRIMRGVGDLLSAALDLPPLPALLVNPGVTLATRDVFAKFSGMQGKKISGSVPREKRPR